MGGCPSQQKWARTGTPRTHLPRHARLPLQRSRLPEPTKQIPAMSYIQGGQPHQEQGPERAKVNAEPPQGSVGHGFRSKDE